MNTTINNNSTNFGANYHLYFYTTDGKRIVSDENMKKCLHYVEAHLNGAKRVQGKRNKDLVDTFCFGQVGKDGKRVGGDADYLEDPVIRTVIDKTKDKVQGFMNIVTGYHAREVSNVYGKPVGKAKHLSKKRTGTTDSFETSYAVNRYIDKAPDYAETNAVYKDGKRMAFGVAFTPVYGKKSHKLQGFEYHHSGFFDESLVK